MMNRKSILWSVTLALVLAAFFVTLIEFIRVERILVPDRNAGLAFHSKGTFLGSLEFDQVYFSVSPTGFLNTATIFINGESVPFEGGPSNLYNFGFTSIAGGSFASELLMETDDFRLKLSGDIASKHIDVFELEVFRGGVVEIEIPTYDKAKRFGLPAPKSTLTSVSELDWIGSRSYFWRQNEWPFL